MCGDDDDDDDVLCVWMSKALNVNSFILEANQQHGVIQDFAVSFKVVNTCSSLKWKTYKHHVDGTSAPDRGARDKIFCRGCVVRYMHGLWQHLIHGEENEYTGMYIFPILDVLNLPNKNGIKPCWKTETCYKTWDELIHPPFVCLTCLAWNSICCTIPKVTDKAFEGFNNMAMMIIVNWSVCWLVKTRMQVNPSPSFVVPNVSFFILPKNTPPNPWHWSHRWRILGRPRRTHDWTSIVQSTQRWIAMNDPPDMCA